MNKKELRKIDKIILRDNRDLPIDQFCALCLRLEVGQTTLDDFLPKKKGKNI